MNSIPRARKGRIPAEIARRARGKEIGRTGSIVRRTIAQQQSELINSTRHSDEERLGRASRVAPAGELENELDETNKEGPMRWARDDSVC